MNTSKVGYIDNIEIETLSNDNFRKVLYTGNQMQLVVMKLAPREEIGLEIHVDSDQFFRIESGKVRVILNGEVSILEPDMALIVPMGVEHNIINISDEEVKLYTIYTPPTHPDGTVEKDKPIEDNH